MKQFAVIYVPTRSSVDFVKIIGWDDETNSYKVEDDNGNKFWVKITDIYKIKLIDDKGETYTFNVK